MNKKNIFKSFLFYIIIISVAICSGVGIAHYELYAKYKLEYRKPVIAHVEYQYETTDLSKEQLTEYLNSIFNNPSYGIYYDNLEPNVLGKCFIGKRLIYIKQGLYERDKRLFTFALTHELVHLTYKTANERFTNFTAYKILYDSGDAYLRYVALHNAELDLNGFMTKPYSFVGYLINEEGRYKI